MTCKARSITDLRIELINLIDSDRSTYCLNSILGTGFSSFVYSAKSVKVTGQAQEKKSDIAIKLVDQKFDVHILAELKALYLLNHPGIPRIIGHSWTPSI